MDAVITLGGKMARLVAGGSQSSWGSGAKLMGKVEFICW